MKFQESLSTGRHAELARLTGEWEGTAKTWFEPNVLADESPVAGTVRPVLNGRFLLHEYSGSLQGNPFDGLGILGFDLAEKRYQMAWIDSFHMSTAILFAEGEGENGFKATGSYFTGAETPRWFWRTEIEIKDDNNIVITAYNISPEGEEAKATETRYSRKF